MGRVLPEDSFQWKLFFYDVELAWITQGKLRIPFQVCLSRIKSTLAQCGVNPILKPSSPLQFVNTDSMCVYYTFSGSLFLGSRS